MVKLYWFKICGFQRTNYSLLVIMQCIYVNCNLCFHETVIDSFAQQFRVFARNKMDYTRNFTFLHEITHHFRINTKPGLHEMAHSFEKNIFYLHEISDEYIIKVMIYALFCV